MDDFVKEIENCGKLVTEGFIERDRKLTNNERYSILKLAELCIKISKESGKNKQNQEEA